MSPKVKKVIIEGRGVLIQKKPNQGIGEIPPSAPPPALHTSSDWPAASSPTPWSGLLGNCWAVGETPGEPCRDAAVARGVAGRAGDSAGRSWARGVRRGTHILLAPQICQRARALLVAESSAVPSPPPFVPPPLFVPGSAGPRPGRTAAASQPRVGAELTANGEGAQRGLGRCSRSPRRGRPGPPAPHCPGPRTPALSRAAAAPARPPPAGPCGGPRGWRTSPQRKRSPGTTSRTWSRVSTEKGAGKRSAPRDPCPLLHCWAVSTSGGLGWTPRAGRTPRGDVRGEWEGGEKGRAAREDPDRARGDLQKSGNRSSSFPKDRGMHTCSPSSPTPT